MTLLRSATTTLLLFAVSILLYNALFSYSYSVGPNYRNVSVDTRVNITNAAPEIMAITMENPVTLAAGSTYLVECNVSVRDFNGYADINYTEAVLYHSSSSATAADDNNTHYTNASCTVVSASGDYKNFTCGFNVYYYANPGTWTCNATVYDNRSYNDTGENTTTFNQVLALNISPTLIDYGNLSIGDTSANKTADITNIGNADIKTSVKGYGAVEGDGLAFVCDQGNISVDNERFSTNVSATWSTKTALTSTFQYVGSMVIPKQTQPGVLQTNTTYWQLYVPPNPFGVCNGTVVFQAESAI